MAASAQQGWNDPLAERNEVLAERSEIVEMPQAAPFEPRGRLRKSGVRELAEACAKLAGAVLESGLLTLAIAGRQARTRTAREAERVALKAKACVDRARREQPIQSLAVLACAGALGGIALRIWRSRS